MSDLQLLRQELMLCLHIVVERHVWEGNDVRTVRGRCGLAIAEEGGDNDEVLGWVESFVFAYKPFVVADGAGVPRRVEDGWE